MTEGRDGAGDDRRSFGRRLLDRVLDLPIRRPWLLIGVALVLSVSGAYIYFNHLELISSRQALTDPDEPYNRRWQEYRRSFDYGENLLVLVATTPAVRAAGGSGGEALPPPPEKAQRAAMKRVADRWAEELRTRPDLFPRVTERIDVSDMGDVALLYLPRDRLETVVDWVDELFPAAQAVALDPSVASVTAQLRRMVDEIEAPADGEEAPQAGLRGGLEALETFFRWFREELEDGTNGSAGELGDRLAELFGEAQVGPIDPEGYLFVGSGRLLTAFAATGEDSERRNRYAPAMARAERALEAARSEIPDSVTLEVGLAGVPAVEYEEMATSQRDIFRSSVLALVLVSALFIWTFRSVLRPALAALCLAMSIGTTFLVPWLFIGHLNILAMVFVVILVALGIDFAIHFYTHYRRALDAGHPPAQAITHTHRAIGVALWLAGLATSLAFFSAYLTEFPGLSELGLIAGSGLLISLLFLFFVFPATLLLVDERWPSPSLRDRRPFRFVRAATRPSGSAGSKVYVVLAALAAALGLAFGEHGMNTDLTRVQPQEGGASSWQTLLLESEDRTTFALAVYDDRAELERARQAFEASPVVRDTQAAFPDNEQKKRALLSPGCERIAKLQVREPSAASARATRKQLFGLRQSLRRYRGASPEAEEALADLEAEVEEIFRLLGELSPGEANARLAAMGEQFRVASAEGLAQGERLFCPPPLDRSNVPEPMRPGFLADDGRLALRIYPARSVWQAEDLAWFIDGARDVDPDIFGGVMNLHENAESLVRSFLQAAAYSSVAIVALLFAWSRSTATSLLAVLPVAAGIGLLLGLMRWGPFDLEWNVANIFAIPILIGVSIDGVVHLVRAWRLGRHETFQGAVEAVFVSALTTMIGFGILATGGHRGVSSLGFVVFLGIGINLLISLSVVPPALAWLEPARGAPPDPEPGTAGAPSPRE